VKLPNFKGLAVLGKAVVAAHKPEILFGTSIVSTVSAVVLAARGGYKSGIQVAEHVVGSEIDTSVVPVKEKIQLTWINYLPAAGATGAALGSTTGLHLVHIKEKKALAAAALMAIDEVRTQAESYKDEVLEIVGDSSKTHEEKEKEVTEASDRLLSPMVDADQLYLVRDELTGRSFYATENKIQNAVNEVNSLLNTRDVDLNTFYVWAGVPEIQDGEEIGWNNRDFITVKWEDSHLADGRPVRAFTFRPKPKSGYDVSGSR
jgi:hypothetical protein